MTSLCGVWWCSNTISMASTFPKVKKSSFLKNIFCLSQKKLTSRVHSHAISRNKYQGVITKRLNFNCPIVVANECFEPIENDLELNAVDYAFSKIFQPEPTNFNSSFGDLELLPSSGFPQRRPRKRKQTNTFSAVEDFTSFWWHLGAQKLIGRAKQKQTSSTTEQDLSGETSTSFPGYSLYFEEVPWLWLVTCLLDFSRFQRCD